MEACHRLDPDCKACGKPVYWKKRIFYLNRLWHLDCFRCSRCKVGLNTDADEENDGQHSKAYLGEDFALRCNRCNEIFERKKLDKAAYSRRELIDRFENELIECKANSRPPVRHHCEHHFRPNDWSRLNIEDEEELRRLVANRHGCHCVGHPCVKDVRRQGEQRRSLFVERGRDERMSAREERRCPKEERRCSENERTICTKDDRRFVVEPKGPTACKRCSLDKRKSVDRKCSLGERKYLKENEDHHHRHSKVANDDRLDGSQSKIDSLEIYRSLFKNKTVMHQSDQQAKGRRVKCTCRGCADYMRKLKA